MRANVKGPKAQIWHTVGTEKNVSSLLPFTFWNDDSKSIIKKGIILKSQTRAHLRTGTEHESSPDHLQTWSRKPPGSLIKTPFQFMLE